MPKVQTEFDSADRSLMSNAGRVSPGNKKRKRSHQSLRPQQTDSRPTTETKKSLDEISKSSRELSGPNPAPKLDAQGRQLQPKSTPGNLLKTQRDSLLKFRRSLPIWPYASEICASLRGSKDVMILVGETGSGKSTQVPQFLLQERWCSGCVAITQPRRVAAVSLARRVAQEMGSPLGAASPASRVGYSVRFDTSVSPGTRIKFLTEGMLLQEMLRDPYLLAYSVVVVDEVHERSVNVDLLLGFLRNLAIHGEKGRKGKRLKIVVMSATADVDALVNFFRAGFTDGDGPKSGPKAPLADGRVDESGAFAKADMCGKEPHSDRVTACHISGRLFPVQVTYLQDPTQNFVESALKCIFQIHYKEPLPGDILVFLTGQDTVESLERLVAEYAKTMDSNVPKILPLPLFAALPQAIQQKVFQPAPVRTRKVILSTNIAETSVTVPGVKFVVDCGKMKIKQFRNRLGLDSLLVKPVSKSSAIQRKGRAGREAEGHCYRLYTKEDYEQLAEVTTPEILRCDLSDALLGMKARGVDDVQGFPFLSPPPREALEKALLHLLQIGALDERGAISEIGLQIAKLPLTPTLGRVIVEASRTNPECLRDIIDIVSCLSVESIFLNVASEEKREAAEEARKELYRRDGDHLTLLATVRGYAAEQTDRKAWSEKYFISHRAMQNVMDVRKQLFHQCKQLHLLGAEAVLDDSNSSYSEQRHEAILKCLLSGFATNTARLTSDGSYKTLVGNQTVTIHPSSVLFGRKIEAIVFTEYVYTNKSYGRNVSAVRLRWIEEALSIADA